MNRLKFATEFANDVENTIEIVFVNKQNYYSIYNQCVKKYRRNKERRQFFIKSMTFDLIQLTNRTIMNVNRKFFE